MTADEMDRKWPRLPGESPEAYQSRVLYESHRDNQAAMLKQAGAVMHPNGQTFGIVLPDLPDHKPHKHSRV